LLSKRGQDEKDGKRQDDCDVKGPTGSPENRVHCAKPFYGSYRLERSRTLRRFLASEKIRLSAWEGTHRVRGLTQQSKLDQLGWKTLDALMNTDRITDNFITILDDDPDATYGVACPVAIQSLEKNELSAMAERHAKLMMRNQANRTGKLLA
jgi:hypothetical protein